MPGIALLVKDQDGIWVGSAGKADIDKKINMEPCHVSKVASLTKIFMGALAFKLQEEGTLNLDAPVSAYLSSSVIGKISNADKVTVRQLLNHTTGIYDVIKDSQFYLGVLNNPPRKWEADDLLKFVEKKDPYFPAGSYVKYSNTNTLLLALVIDKAAGRPHWELLREKIINPLQLKDTYYYFRENLPDGKIAQGYYDLHNNGTILNLSNYNTGSGNGYTGLYSTVGDLYAFIDALFVQQSLLSPTSMNEMLNFNTIEEPNSNRLLGPGVVKDFIHRDDPTEYAYGHRGRDLAYSADAFHFPEKNQTFALIVNYGTDANSSLRPVFFDMRNEIVDKMMGK